MESNIRHIDSVMTIGAFREFLKFVFSEKPRKYPQFEEVA